MLDKITSFEGRMITNKYILPYWPCWPTRPCSVLSWVQCWPWKDV